MNEIERVSLAHEIVIGPENFKMQDTAHDTLTNDSKSVRDKKSKDK